MGDLSANFSEWEFRCKCGCGEVVVTPGFLKRLQDARSIADVPFNINSGYRCRAYNLQIGGASDSEHLYGNAADISYNSNNHTAYAVLFALRDAGFTRFKFYPGHIHVDKGEVRGKTATLLMWGKYK